MFPSSPFCSSFSYSSFPLPHGNRSDNPFVQADLFLCLSCQVSLTLILTYRSLVQADLEVLIARSNSLAAKFRSFTRGPSDEDVKLADALAALVLALTLLEVSNIWRRT
jgi:hypothetical protein